MAVFVNSAMQESDLVRFDTHGMPEGQIPPWRYHLAGGPPLVGTFSHDGALTGDASGGIIRLGVTMVRDLWGFPELLVIKAVAVSVNTDPGTSRVGWKGAGNRRLNSAMFITLTPVVAGSDYNLPEFVMPNILIEPTDEGGQVLELVSSNNTDGTTYHLHLFGWVYDLARLAVSGDYQAVIESL